MTMIRCPPMTDDPVKLTLHSIRAPWHSRALGAPTHPVVTRLLLHSPCVLKLSACLAEL